MNTEVSQFLDEKDHPLREEIQKLRGLILKSKPGMQENIKWNGPNYTYADEDRVTMRIHPPKQIQLIFHRGAKKLAMPPNKLIDDDAGLLSWRENDRAIASFKNMQEIEKNKEVLVSIIQQWIDAAK